MEKFKKGAQALVFLSILSVVATLVGCGSDEPKQYDVQGQLALADGGQLPDDASARISLIENGSAGGENRIVAERTLHNLDKLPVHFDMKVGSELLGTGGQYGVSAQIMDGSGNVRWQTPLPQSVAPRQQNQPTKLMLQAYGAGMAGDFRQYRCDDGFRFEMASNSKQAVLHLGKRQVSLVPRKSGSAQTTVYANDHGDQLTFGHDKITLAVDGTSHMSCRPRTQTAGNADADSDKRQNHAPAMSNNDMSSSTRSTPSESNDADGS